MRFELTRFCLQDSCSTSWSYIAMLCRKLVFAMLPKVSVRHACRTLVFAMLCRKLVFAMLPKV